MLLGELEVALDVGRQLEALGVAWLLGGSVASSILGEPRATADVDIVADLRGRHVSALFAALVDTYYVDEDAARAAVRTRGAFNVIQLASMTRWTSTAAPTSRWGVKSSGVGSSSISIVGVFHAPPPRTSSCRS